MVAVEGCVGCFLSLISVKLEMTNFHALISTCWASIPNSFLPKLSNTATHHPVLAHIPMFPIDLLAVKCT